MLSVPDQTFTSDNFRYKWQPVHFKRWTAHMQRGWYEAFIMRCTDLLHSFIHWRSGCKASWYDASFGLDPSSLLNQRCYRNIGSHIPTTSLPFEVPTPTPQIHPANPFLPPTLSNTMQRSCWIPFQPAFWGFTHWCRLVLKPVSLSTQWYLFNTCGDKGYRDQKGML